MLDLQRLQRIKLSARPPMQIFVAYWLLQPIYRWIARTKIEIEGLSNLPKDRPVFFAMNHTDRYTNFPFQVQIHRLGFPCTTSWVKGKYYENRVMAWFLSACSNIPLPSRGYVLSVLFREMANRAPKPDEYRQLRSLVDGGECADLGAIHEDLAEAGGAEEFSNRFRHIFGAMAAESVRLTRDALLDVGLNVMVFPDGTRRKRIGKGHTGLAQFAQHISAPIVPVGCSGGDRMHPGNTPWPRSDRIVYRIGEPLEVDGPELKPFRVPDHVVPMTQEANQCYAAEYRQITDVVMSRLNQLVDPEYQFDPNEDEDAEQGAGRFISSR